ncbi:MAG: hypothetical protein V1907_01475 [Candidatus Kerfeldbacteria bacterium]
MAFREQHRESELDLQPCLLDLVKIDGRWAQVISGPETSQVLFLDNGSGDTIRWSDYTLARPLHTHVRLIQERGRVFTDEELSRIRWGSEQKEKPDLVQEISVFGEFTRRETE